MLEKILAWNAMSTASFGSDGAGLVLCNLAARTMLLDPLRKFDRAIDDRLPLPIDGDDVIAVVEHQHLDEPAEPFLKVKGILEAREIILARMGDEDRSLDARKPRLHVVGELPELIKRKRVGARMSGDARVPPGNRLRDECAHAFVLDAIRLAFREAVTLGLRQEPEPAQEELMLGNGPAIIPEGRREAGNAVNALGLERGKPQGQDGSDRQPADDDRVANGLEV